MRAAVTTTALASLFLASPTFGQGVSVGDEAPNFTLQASDGKTYTLSDFKGKQAVVIAWFPKTFTGG